MLILPDKINKCKVSNEAKKDDRINLGEFYSEKIDKMY